MSEVIPIYLDTKVYSKNETSTPNPTDFTENTTRSVGVEIFRKNRCLIHSSHKRSVCQPDKKENI